MDKDMLNKLINNTWVYDFARMADSFDYEDKARLKEALERELNREMKKFHGGSYDLDALETGNRAVNLSEKILLISDSYKEYKTASDHLTDVLFTRAFNYEKEELKFTSENPGFLGVHVKSLEKDIKNLEPVPAPQNILPYCIAALVCAVGIAMMLFNPGVKEFFNGEWLRSGILAISAVIVIAMFFVGGFAGSGVSLVGLALLWSFLSSTLGLGFLARLVISVLLGFLLIVTGSAAVDGYKLEKSGAFKRDNMERKVLKRELDDAKNYAQKCADKTSNLLADKNVREYYADVLKKIKELESEFAKR